MSPLKHKLALLIPSLLLSAFALSSCLSKMEKSEIAFIRGQIDQALDPLGGQNWIIIAEAAYPAYASPGIETITINAPADFVLAETLDSLESSGKTQARIYVPSEMYVLRESYAPGIKSYRKNLNKLIPGRFHYKLPSQTIQAQVENAKRRFRVLVIKTTTTLPYSNIYLSLDSAYWDSSAETALQQLTQPPIKRITAPEEVPAILTPVVQPPIDANAVPATTAAKPPSNVATPLPQPTHNDHNSPAGVPASTAPSINPTPVTPSAPSANTPPPSPTFIQAEKQNNEKI